MAPGRRRPRHARRDLRRRRRLRRAGLAVAVVVVAAAASVGVERALGTATPALRRAVPTTPPQTAATSTTTTTTTVPTTTTVAPSPAEPWGGTTLVPGHRVVAFAGTPGDRGAGVVGTAAPEALWSRLAAAAAQYAGPGVVPVPAFEITAVEATRSAGPAGTFSAALPAATVDAYLAVAHRHGGMLVLDVQPGRQDPVAAVTSLSPWLADPSVAVALDPQFEQPSGVPDGTGHTTAAEVGAVAGWLAQFCARHGLPQKLLLVRLATPSAVTDLAALGSPPPGVALVVGVDQAGPAPVEAAAYARTAGATGLPLGYQVSTTALPYPSIGQVLAEAPPPALVEYR